ncbi:MAG: DegT/DnrJ/EryC1/StrS family aminotransferase [Methanobacterium sp.]
MGWKIPLFKIFWDESDVEYVTREIHSGRNWAVGSNIEKFEEMIRERVGTDYAVVFNSGTSALQSSLIAHNIHNGDEVIVPSFTFISTANSPLFVGAKPIFADIERETLGLDPSSVLENITKKTKAIIPIHYGGCPCKIGELRDIADDHDLVLIEDASESLGAKIREKNVGTFGDSAVLSFCQNKIITTGEGGAVVTDSRKIYEKLLLIRSHGRLESSDFFSSLESFDYVTLGYNFRMSNLTAALGISQIGKLNKIIEMRRSNSRYLTENLNDLFDHIHPIEPLNDYYNVYQLYSVLADDRDALMEYLTDNGIMTKIYFDPVHQTYFYKKKLQYNVDLPVTMEIANKVVTLPMYPDLQRDEIDFIVSEIKNFYSR